MLDSLQTAPLRIQKLSPRHNRKGFDCGVEPLNEYIQAYARQNERLGISVTRVAVRGDSPEILGFYSLSSGHVTCGELPEQEARRLPNYPIPVVRMGRLATSLAARGTGVGAHLLIDALRISLGVSKDIGIYAIEVDAKSTQAREFYRHYGFAPLSDHPLHMYLTMKTVQALFG
ncbi:MAG: GNAT family N-acetyltransferase [Rhodothermales bacterium]